MALPIPSFIDRDPAVIAAEITAQYEQLVGRKMEPAQVEQLILNSFAYRESLVRNQIQDAALQNLVAFARFPALDYLGELVGVTRLPSEPARTTIQFSLVAGHGNVVIPEGLRVSTTDGRVIFQIIQDVPVDSSVNTATVTAIAQVNGVSGNDYALGTVSTILDPQPYLATAENTTVTEGGSEEETDEQLRDRIKLAPNAFSVAGPYKAYEFWAKSASPFIIDVSVGNRHYKAGDTIPSGKAIGDIIPGTVEVFPLVVGLSVTPPEILEAVNAVLTADRIRPLNDKVYVTSPEAVATTIEVDLTLYDGAVQADIVPVVQAQLEEFRDGRRKLLGQDIVLSQIISLSVIDGVYDVEVVDPPSDLIINETQFANITNIIVNVVGTNVG